MCCDDDDDDAPPTGENRIEMNRNDCFWKVIFSDLFSVSEFRAIEQQFSYAFCACILFSNEDG